MEQAKAKAQMILTPDEVAARLRISPSTLAQWRSQRRGPAYVKVGSRVRYLSDAIDRYLAGQTREPETGAQKIPPLDFRPARAATRRGSRLGGHRTKIEKAQDAKRTGA